ncbi:hypothetical protein HYU13_00540 [Candidatus Woesearchaeota archaeon]|nr:hypothetical protein [Candidatus Woesearchaeota archaeon]
MEGNIPGQGGILHFTLEDFGEQPFRNNPIRTLEKRIRESKPAKVFLPEETKNPEQYEFLKDYMYLFFAWSGKYSFRIFSPKWFYQRAGYHYPKLLRGNPEEGHYFEFPGMKKESPIS